ncbi:hypothetical protein HPB48_001023 [Haemaphysalis longicornis]|uniref:Uncharacterized protein n=1 Tax=Haemaphysalis longicornis TaxID=44386 RepID=A0A9J6G1N2_HAELO|nr:hypothetical protein HPB48_001023 [Haemaphysalis longicornis]
MDVTSPHAVAPEASSFVVPSQIPLSCDVDDMDQQPSEAFFCTKEDDENNTAPWIEVTRRAQRKKQNSTTPDAGTTPLKPAMKPTRNPSQVSRKPRPPPLPENDYKMVIRPRNGLALSKVSPYTLASCILHEAKLTWREADLKIRTNEAQNILVVSTPYIAAAKALSKIQQLKIEDTIFPVNTYGISPDNSCKGVIHHISLDATPEQIMAVLSAPGCEPLTCRRLGATGTMLITFAGKKVPFFVYIGGVETRCYLYKRTHTFCHLCHSTGHRADVCPKPNAFTDAHCKRCGLLRQKDVPHHCQPKCALCDGEHVTASKECPKRFLPPVSRRKKQREVTKGRRTSRESRSRSKSRGPSRERSKTRSRSRSRGRTPSAKRRSAEDATAVQVSWAQMLSPRAQTPPPPPPNPPNRDELAELKRLNAQLLAEIKQQREENRQLHNELLALKAEIRQGINPTPEKRRKPDPTTPEPAQIPPSSSTSQPPRTTEFPLAQEKSQIAETVKEMMIMLKQITQR